MTSPISIPLTWHDDQITADDRRALREMPPVPALHIVANSSVAEVQAILRTRRARRALTIRYVATALAYLVVAAFAIAVIVTFITLFWVVAP